MDPISIPIWRSSCTAESNDRSTLKWTSKILETYVHGTNTGNFVPLEKYVQSMTEEEENFDDVNVDEICMPGEVHSSQRLPALERTDQSRLSAMGMYYCCCMFAAVIPWAGERVSKASGR
jgi:hypothetical protein